MSIDNQIFQEYRDNLKNVKDAKILLAENKIQTFDEDTVIVIANALRLAKDCTFADELTQGAKDYLVSKIDEGLKLLNQNKEESYRNWDNDEIKNKEDE